MHSEIGRLHEYFWPNALHQLVFAEKLTMSFEQGYKNFKCSAADANRFVSFEQCSFLCKNPKPAKTQRAQTGIIGGVFYRDLHLIHTNRGMRSNRSLAALFVTKGG